MRVVFFGTPQIAAECLEFLLDHNVDIVAIVTKPDRPKGRSQELIPPPVKESAQQKVPHIPILQPDLISAPGCSDPLIPLEADLFVVVAYGEIIKRHLLEMPKRGCINLHASLLPKYRGAAPIHHAIINGEAKSGATIMYMVMKMDAGDMIKQVEVDIGPNMTCGELEKEITHVGKKALLDVIQEFEAGSVSSITQDPEKVSFAPKIELKDCEVNWEYSAQQLHNLIRGVNPHPGAWCWIKVRDQIKRMKLFSTAINSELSGNPGEILTFGEEGITIACCSGALNIEELQLEGKKKMSGAEFVRGHHQVNIVFNPNRV